ncbi:MAG: hypothetical protein E6H04_13065 [Bacillati bacterium ANGP1]|uniref:Uncharacterized protein n=1 Tax=Candidatus Segetimicrobium genomatis TaxID=2569760 RepID=A0A537J3I2_9BACT|nr:MAG: hypothetical protein E6H04_13065 [Terrabacteria group bacterium ANGP1]
MNVSRRDPWGQLWGCLTALRQHAARLRSLSQHEPLAQRGAGYPHAGLGRPHADEVREVLSAVQARLEEVRTLLPTVLPAGVPLPGIAATEAPQEVGRRVDTLIRLASTLAQEAFQPLPPLPPHAPPYLVEPPGHDLAGTKAVLLAGGIEEIATSVRTAMLSAVNAGSG